MVADRVANALAAYGAAWRAWDRSPGSEARVDALLAAERPVAAQLGVDGHTVAAAVQQARREGLPPEKAVTAAYERLATPGTVL